MADPRLLSTLARLRGQTPGRAAPAARLAIPASAPKPDPRLADTLAKLKGSGSSSKPTAGTAIPPAPIAPPPLPPQAAKLMAKWQADDAGENRSLLGQIGGAIEGGTKGLLGLPGAAVKSVGMLGEIGGAYLEAAYDDTIGGKSVDWSNVGPSKERILDQGGLAGGIVGSADNTATRWLENPLRTGNKNPLGVLDPATGVREYQKAIDEGRIVDVVLEDVGNLAGAGGAVSKGLGIAGDAAIARGSLATGSKLNAASDAARLATHRLGQVAAAPVTLPFAAAGAAGRAAVPRLAARNSFFARYTPKGREMLAMADEARRNAANPSAEASRMMQRAIEDNPNLVDADGNTVRLSVDEGAAVVGLRTGDIEHLKMVLDDMGADPNDMTQVAQVIEAMHGGVLKEGHHLTPEAAKIGFAVLEGRATPEQLRRLAPARGVLDDLAAQVEENATSGFGRVRPLELNPLSDVDPAVLRNLTGQEAAEAKLWAADASDTLARARAAEAADASRHRRPSFEDGPVSTLDQPLKAENNPGGRNAPFGVRPSFAEMRDPSEGTFSAPWRGIQERQANVLAAATDATLARSEEARAAAGYLADLETLKTEGTPFMLGLETQARNARRAADLAEKRAMTSTNRIRAATLSKSANELRAAAMLIDDRVGKLRPFVGDQKRLTGEIAAARVEDSIVQASAQDAFEAMLRSEERNPATMREDRLVNPRYTPNVEMFDLPNLQEATLNPSTRARFGSSGSERFRSGASATPFDLAAQGKLLTDELENQIANEEYRKMVAAGDRVGSVVGPQGISRIDQLADEYMRRRGYDATYAKQVATAEVMEAARMEPWPPVKEGGTANLKSTKMRIEDIDDDTMWFPIGLREAVSQRMSTAAPPKALMPLHRFNGWMKRLVLPASVNWHLGDAVSNMLFGAVAGVSPIEMLRGIELTKRLVATDGGARLFEKMAAQSDIGSLSYGDHIRWIDEELARFEKLAGGDTPPSMLRRGSDAVLAGPRKLQSAGFNLNRKINEYQRNAYKIVKLERRLKDLGYTLDPITIDGASTGKSFLDLPPRAKLPADVTAAIEDVVQDANKVFGATPLSPFERNYVTAAIPFYHWMKTVNLFALRLARDHPARMIWTMQLARQAQDDPQLPAFMNGAWNTPFGWISMQSVNPGADLVGDEGIPTVLSGSGLLRSLSPVIKTAAAGAFGMDLNRGGAPLTHAPGWGGVTEAGRPAMPALIKRPGALLGYAARQIGPIRSLVDLAPSVDLPGGLSLGYGARYGSSEAILENDGSRLGGERTFRNQAPLVAGAVGLRVPWPTYTDEQLAEMAASEAKRRRANLERQNG